MRIPYSCFEVPPLAPTYEPVANQIFDIVAHPIALYLGILRRRPVEGCLYTEDGGYRLTSVQRSRTLLDFLCAAGERVLEDFYACCGEDLAML